jgi:hypothetical protein
MKEKIILGVAIAFPILFLGGLFVASNMNLGPKPEYNFVYSYQSQGGNNYDYNNNILHQAIVVKDGYVTASPEILQKKESGYCYTQNYNQTTTKYDYIKNDKNECWETDPAKLLKFIYENNVRFYLYDVATDSEHELTLEELSKIRLRDTVLSPDRFSFAQSYRNRGLMQEVFVGGSSGNNYILEKDGQSYNLNLSNKGDRYSYGTTVFTGWVEKDIN